MRRYWDGHAWVDVDQVVEKKVGDDLVADPAMDPPAHPVNPLLRLVAQRRPDPDGSTPPDLTPPVDDIETPHE